MRLRALPPRPSCYGSKGILRPQQSVVKPFEVAPHKRLVKSARDCAAHRSPSSSMCASPVAARDPAEALKLRTHQSRLIIDIIMPPSRAGVGP
jgi:hypothetical protein